MQKRFQIFLVVLFIVVFVVVGVIYWSTGQTRQVIQNQDPSLSQSVYSQSSPPADWKTSSYNDYGIVEIQYPAYYYVKSAIIDNAPYWRTSQIPAFELVLSEIPPGGSTKSHTYPNISIGAFKKMKIADFLVLLRNIYGDVSQKKLIIGEYNVRLLEWSQSKDVKNQAIFIERLKFLYVINPTDLSTQSTLKDIILHLKLSP